MGKLRVNKTLVRLSPKQFEKWFKSNSDRKGLDWKIYYKKIGGVLPSPKPRVVKDPPD